MNLRPALLPVGLLLAACSQPPAATAGPATTADSASPAADGPANCRHHAPRALELALDGVTSVSFEVGPDTLVLTGQEQATGQLSGRACAASADLLDGLQITQQREGDQLRVKLETPIRQGLSLGRERYAWLDLRGSLPAQMPLSVQLGSGDVRLTGTGALQARVGSGDLVASRIGGPVQLTLGSGDVQIDNASGLAATLGSGDLEASAITGAVELTVGSGDVKLHGIGSLSIPALGSGDIQAGQINGDVSIGSVGSGDIQLQTVTGSVRAQTIGSGELRVDQASGSLQVQQLGSGEVKHNNIGGAVQLPRKP